MPLLVPLGIGARSHSRDAALDSQSDVHIELPRGIGRVQNTILSLEDKVAAESVFVDTEVHLHECPHQCLHDYNSCEGQDRQTCETCAPTGGGQFPNGETENESGTPSPVLNLGSLSPNMHQTSVWHMTVGQTPGAHSHQFFSSPLPCWM